jgi:hypothetical protein
MRESALIFGFCFIEILLLGTYEYLMKTAMYIYYVCTIAAIQK